MAGTCITETVGEMVVELRETRLENKRVRDKTDNKGAAEYFGANLAHLLNLVQVTKSIYLTPIWEARARALKKPSTLGAAEGI